MERKHCHHFVEVGAYAEYSEWHAYGQSKLANCLFFKVVSCMESVKQLFFILLIASNVEEHSNLVLEESSLVLGILFYP